MRDLGPPSPNTRLSNGEPPPRQRLQTQEPTAPAPPDAGAGSAASKQNSMVEPRVGAAMSLLSNSTRQSTAETSIQHHHRQNQQQQQSPQLDLSSPDTSPATMYTGRNVYAESEVTVAVDTSLALGSISRITSNGRVARPRMVSRESGAPSVSDGVGNGLKPKLNSQPQQGSPHLTGATLGARRTSGIVGTVPPPSHSHNPHLQQHPQQTQARNVSDAPVRGEKRGKQQEAKRRSQYTRSLVLAPTTSRLQERQHLIGGGRNGSGWLVDSSGRPVAPVYADDTETIVSMNLSRVPKTPLPLPKAVSSGTPVLYPKQCVACSERVSARLGEPVLLRDERHGTALFRSSDEGVGVEVTQATSMQLHPTPQQQQLKLQQREREAAQGAGRSGRTTSTLGSTWRLRERTKTCHVGIILCLNIGEISGSHLPLFQNIHVYSMLLCIASFGGCVVEWPAVQSPIRLFSVHFVIRYNIYSI